MTPFERVPCPEFWEVGCAEWTVHYVKRLNAGLSFAWPTQKKYRDARAVLLEMTRHRCAYCDAILGVESRETIDHFKPKHQNGFPELAYEWTNLYPACDMCQSHKRSQFDANLIRPDRIGYTFESHFVNDFASGEILPNPAAPDAQRAMAQVTLEILGLNIPARKAARKRARRQFLSAIPELAPDEFNYRYFACAAM
jgi:uncharacterized protein (TIGR02646 family)